MTAQAPRRRQRRHPLDRRMTATKTAVHTCGNCGRYTAVVNGWAHDFEADGHTPSERVHACRQGEVIGHPVDLQSHAESSLDVANARLRAHLCPDCGSRNTRFYARGSTNDPGDSEPAADCNDCGWGY